MDLHSLVATGVAILLVVVGWIADEWLYKNFIKDKEE